MNAAQIERSLEILRYNGQCAFGPWMTADEITNRDVVDAIVDEVMEANCRNMRGEASGCNTDICGRVVVGGEVFLYRR